MDADSVAFLRNKGDEGLEAVNVSWARFLAGYFLSGKDNTLSYHVPSEDPSLTRLTGLEENEDGSWTAQVCEYRSGGFTRREDRITLEKLGEDWYVVAKVEPVS